ncbi:MAG: phosphate regulon sensor histidine kinase PhoR [Betaproteobacteria bacterium]|nr:phosphate regulon sensor histidine kinase PhoR [Betaproteobacteria bacterium]
MASVWLALGLRLLGIAAASALAGAIFGAVTGLACAALALAALLTTHTLQLARLQRWLKAPERRDIPDAWGAWGNVFVELYRMLRREHKAVTRVQGELEIFSQAAEASPDGLVILDADDRILWSNRVAEQHLGLRGEQDVGLLLTNLVRLPGLTDLIAKGSKGTTLLHRPGERKGMVYSIEVVRFGKDRKLLVSFDVTQIERAETMRRDFVANVSHELRTPLTVITGFIEHLVEDTGGREELARRQLLIMDDQAQRMLRLVDDLLTLSRLEGEVQSPREEEIDLAALVEDLRLEGLRLSNRRHAVLGMASPDRLRGSREELRSAFSNLVSNAVRYTPEGGSIRIHWTIRDGRGVFSVEDTGIGIAEEHIPRLTERFYRVDRGRSRDSGGTGLGLAIVKHVLLRHQATLEISSQAGLGSTFSAVFPAWRVLPPEPSSAVTQPQDSRLITKSAS